MEAELGTSCSSISMLKVKIIILKRLLIKDHCDLINSFHADGLFVYPLKTYEILFY